VADLIKTIPPAAIHPEATIPNGGPPQARNLP